MRKQPIPDDSIIQPPLTYPYPKVKRERFVGVNFTSDEYRELVRRSGDQKRGAISDYIREAVFGYIRPNGETDD